MVYDIVIVGAGPAGLTAAIYALRADKKILILEKETFGGQITFSPKVENYPSQISLSGNELAEKMLDQVMTLGAEIELACVNDVQKCDYGFQILTDAGTFEARSVIIAAGSRHRHLGLPNEEALIGKGIYFCAVCDGAFFAGRDVAVIGGGNTALQEAVMLSEICRKVYVVQNLSRLTGEGRQIARLERAKNVTILYDSVVKELIGSNTLDHIVIHNTQTNTDEVLNIDGVFVAIGQQPDNAPFAQIAMLNEYGYIQAGEDCLTQTPGIFVAGDCRTKTIRQVTTAAADGTIAALSACRYLDSLSD